MSVRGCIAYICRERGIVNNQDSKSRKIDIDNLLYSMEERRRIEECELIGINLMETPKPSSGGKRNDNFNQSGNK